MSKQKKWLAENGQLNVVNLGEVTAMSTHEGVDHVKKTDFESLKHEFEEYKKHTEKLIHDLREKIEKLDKIVVKEL